MASDASDAGTTGKHSELEAQALRLWTFIQKRVSIFSKAQALEILRELAPSDRDQLKPFAKRLRTTLAARRAIIPHVAALEAAALVLRNEGWYQARQGQLIHTLKLFSLLGDDEEMLADWRHAGGRLIEVCEEWKRQHPEARAFQIGVGPAALTVLALQIGDHLKERDWPATPIAVINPIVADERWLSGVTTALEPLRRRLEETYVAPLDGLAILEWCDRQLPVSIGFPTISANDTYNSELVLMRQDNGIIEEEGYEIVRGDELACWIQFEQAMEGKIGAISVDDSGGWVCGKARFVWSVHTLHPKEFIPGLVHSQVGTREATRLLHRYRLAKRIFGKAMPYRAGRKRLDYLGGPAEKYRVNRHALLLALAKVGLTWEEYCEELGEPGMALEAEMPVGLIMQLVSRLKLEDPNRVFGRPARAELVRADDDTVLRALLPRVDHIRYRACSGLQSETSEIIQKAVSELGSSILIRQGAFPSEDPLPDLVYGSDGEELREKLDRAGLVAYVGVIPHFMKIPDGTELPADMWPYAFGHSLYLDIDVRGA
jgi:hypothetical protein